MITLQGTNISPQNGILKMIFLFPRWDMLILWRVITLVFPLMLFWHVWHQPIFGVSFIDQVSRASPSQSKSSSYLCSQLMVTNPSSNMCFFSRPWKSYGKNVLRSGHKIPPKKTNRPKLSFGKTLPESQVHSDLSVNLSGGMRCDDSADGFGILLVLPTEAVTIGWTKVHHCTTANFAKTLKESMIFFL